MFHSQNVHYVYLTLSQRNLGLVKRFPYELSIQGNTFIYKKLALLNCLHKAKEFTEYVVHTHSFAKCAWQIFYDTARRKYNLRNVHLQCLSFSWWSLGINCKLH